MTGPLPVLTNGLLRLTYSTDEPLRHATNLNVTLALYGGVYQIQAFDATQYAAASAASDFFTLMMAFYNAGSNAERWDLFHNVSGVLTLLQTGTIATAGSSGAPTQKGNQLTFTGRDSLLHLDKIVLLGSSVPAPFRVAWGGGSAALNAFTASVLNNTTGHIGWWYNSKSAVFIKSGIATIGTLNRRSRRKLNLV